MARFTKRIGLGTLGLLLGFGAPRLAAQTWAVTASDPVGIARSGTGVAFGQSLEAAALNPALLASIKDKSSYFLAFGQELQITQSTLQTNQIVESSTDRNRFLPSFGASWRTSPVLVLGLKLDEPFMRHADMPLTATSRFLGQRIDLKSNRLEAQAGYALSPNWSIGASLGVTRIHYAYTNMVRLALPTDATQPVSASNVAVGLMEVGITQEASKVAPSYSVGFRWAPSPRWTIGGSYVGSVSATLPLTASLSSVPPSYFDLTGYGQPIVGAASYGPALLAQIKTQPGAGKITLPGRATLGVRQRTNQLFTWEADIHYSQGASTQLPGYAGITAATVPGTVVQGSGLSETYQNSVGASIMGELAIGKRLTARLGLAQSQNLRAATDMDPMVGGAKNSTFSGGFGYRVAGGEVNLGYQFRQSQDVDSRKLDQVWSQSGLRTTGATTRVEGMGHLWSIGFKKAF